ncbi:MAG: penicillin acylase family protein [Alphaproteobacteria bacterium]|nr:penicillin acylase family protein [Alphaproteobacteria bacterium]
MLKTILFRLFCLVLVFGPFAGCAFLTPLPAESTLEERLARFPTQDLPLEATVTVHWDAHQVPFIAAKTDTDLAFTLGLVHAHLRLGQMEILRRIAHGRIAEMAGPLAVDIDHSLRLLNFSRAAPAIEASLPPATKAWLEAYVRGINHYQAKADPLPHEYAVLGMAREPWQVRDVLTIGRLAASDVNWLVWFQLLKLHAHKDWPDVWARLLKKGGDSKPSFAASHDDTLAGLLQSVSRSGSNSFAVSAKRSKTGAAMIANDPHLGIMLPNLWLIAGYQSPSYHAVGLMVPGLPFIAIGRNERIAWGGTNMRAASSDLFDVSALAKSEVTERVERIRVRWWFDRDVVIRETPHGPLLSDAPLLEYEGPPFALKWVGHAPSDEITAMLKLNRAENFQAFRDALSGFAVSGQNMLYADVDGHIGQAMAVKLPARVKAVPKDLLLNPNGPETKAWQAFRDASNLPASLDPPTGILASANNRPAAADVPVAFFFSSNDRMNRITDLLNASEKLNADDLHRIQRDVHMPSSIALRELFLEKIARLNAARSLLGNVRDFINSLRNWDGNYDVGSKGAVAFELFLYHFQDLFYGRRFANGEKADYSRLVLVRSLLEEDIEQDDPELLAADLREALRRATEDAERFENWGEMHRLKLAHPLRYLPVFGGKYHFADWPTPGSSQTIRKTAHRTTNERHETRYGSNAWHVSDLSDLDHNDFVLLGGQDGWLHSSTFQDQVPLWREGRTLRVPLRIETVERTFAHKITLAP